MTTPIDPTAGEELSRAYGAASVKAKTWDYLPARDAQRAGALAVARAVVPEGFAVYDTRTHFVVPRDEVPEWACQRCGGYGLISLPCENGFADGPCPDCDGQGVRTSESEVSR
jgi:hypothetical protein